MDVILHLQLKKKNAAVPVIHCKNIEAVFLILQDGILVLVYLQLVTVYFIY